MLRTSYWNFLTRLLLSTMAVPYNFHPRLKKYLKGADGWIDFTIGFCTASGSVEQVMRFRDGRVKTGGAVLPEADVVMKFRNEALLREMLRLPPNEILNLLLKNRMQIQGNLSYLQLFNFYVSRLQSRKQRKMMLDAARKDVRRVKREMKPRKERAPEDLEARRRRLFRAVEIDQGVQFLADPYLTAFTLDHFPRLKRFLDIHFETPPEICIERPLILTRWYRRHGFETTPEGKPWVPEIRQAKAFRHLMETRRPLIRENDLIAGTTTTKEIGCLIFPDAQGTMIWGELFTLDKRLLNPYRIAPEEIDILHHEILPFWTGRNFREWVRTRHHDPLCQRIEERWVAYFVWKSVGISHTIPDFKQVLEKGTLGIIQEIEARMAAESGSLAGAALEAMKISLEGMNAYARNLASEARRQAESAPTLERREECLRMAEICARIPAHPAATLDEAVHAIWLTWVGLHMENTNTGLSLGRLDQLLQPYFAADMALLATPEEREAYIRYALELVGCLFMRMTDHLPLIPDIGNYLFGGASATQAVTVGGVTPAGEDAVCDMTYIILKITEMLSIRDPNVNARFHPEKNSDTYLYRLCDVNYVTSATPSMHNDLAVFKALEPHGYPLEHIRDWSSTGCVEPTLSGRHMGHTGSILFNLVAALEMALNNGRHPLMEWDLGPRTGRVENGDFKSFDAFLEAFAAQLDFLVKNAVELNNLLAAAHAELRPTPFLSALMEGAIGKGLDVTRGGARYNTSGTSNIGLADVIDSMMAVKKLVFDQRKTSFAELKHAMDAGFESSPFIRALVRNKVPLFGSGNPEPLAMADRLIRMIHETYGRHKNFRGGRYTAGFWSMSQHVAYGNLSGALPSGRQAGKAFTPGLTPTPHASRNYLDNIRDVAALNPRYMDNNIAFNVKLTPAPGDSREDAAGAMAGYVKAYFRQGGMQIQFNVVNSDTLRDAMVHPEKYRNLLVRISGYNAYFVTLNREMQLELIERAEYGLNG